MTADLFCWCGFPRPETGMPLTGSESTGPCAAPGPYREGNEGRQMGKVKALQYLLTHSFSGKALAVRRVTENQGRTPGVDGETWNYPPKKGKLFTAGKDWLSTTPLRRVYIPKSNGKMRPSGSPR